MKKFLLLFGFVPFFLIAQADKFKVGLTASTGLSWMNSEAKEITTEENNISFKLLATAEYQLSEKFSITGGVGLSNRQGGELQYGKGGNLWSESASKLSIPRPDSLPDGVLLRYKANYLDFPIGFKVQTPPVGKIKFFIHPDLGLGIRLNAKGDISGANVLSTKENIKSQIFFLAFNWGLNIGSEYALTDEIGLLFGLRYQQSLSDVTDDSGRYYDNTKVNYKDKISNLDLKVGVIF
ncbi:MAG: PorT family protein [Saprospiraceae bacterium]|nr:PorT family protein [Saprospiraceae bacterium]